MIDHSEEIKHWTKLLEQHRRNLQQLREQLATFGQGEKRLDKLNQLMAEEDEIRQAKAALRQLGVIPDHLPGEPEEVEFFPERFTDDFPHPIAVACYRFNGAANDVERFLRLDDLLQHTVKYLAAIALAQYRADAPQEERLHDWLGALSHPSLDDWARLLGEVCDHYAQAEHLPRIASRLIDGYSATASDDSPLARMHRLMVEEQKGKKAARQIDTTPFREFLEQLLAYRRTWELGPPDSGKCQRLLLLLQPALRQFLERFDLIAAYPLRYIEHISPAKPGWHYTLLSFQDHSGKPVLLQDPFHDPQPSDTPRYKLRRLYLCDAEGRLHLNLHPILISHLYQLYFLEYNAENRQICYRPCAQGEPFYPPAHVKSYLLTCLDPPAEEGGPNLPEQLQQVDAGLAQAEDEKVLAQMPLPALLAHLSTEGREALQIALGESLRLGHFWLGVEFLLMALSRQEGQPLGALLHELRQSRGQFRGMLRGVAGVATKDDWRQANVTQVGAEAFDRLQEIDPATAVQSYQASQTHLPVVTPRMMQVLRDAAHMAGEGQIGHAHLLLAVLRHPHCPPVTLLLGLAVQAGWQPDDVPAWVAQQAGLNPADLRLPDLAPGPRMPPPRQAGPDRIYRADQVDQFRDAAQPPLKVRGVLATCGRDLTTLAKDGKLRPAVGEGAKKAMLQIGLILQQTQANNPVLLGDPGVGKTAIVEGFAWRLAVGAEHGQPVIPQLANKRIVDLSPAALLAGTKYRGEMEERVQKLLAEVREARGQVVVFVDELHTILSGGAEGGLGAIADALKPALARGEFPCIGATTVGEYRRHIEGDPALARRFTPVWIDEPSPEEAVEIAAIVAQEHLGPSHNATYPPEVVEEAVRLAVRYLHDERLPGKAIKLLDQAGPRVMLGGSLSGLKGPAEPGTAGAVTVEAVREIVAERTGVPLTRLSEGEGRRLLDLEARLKQRVKGQDEAVAEVARVVKRARAGLSDPRRPLGVFLLAGPTGVGKTELALALAEALFDEEDAILRLDMSEYMEKHQISRLIGSPPGYVGYDEEGQLTGRLRRRPYSVVLLDEIEKAHQDVQHLFLQLFDAGRLTDARGHLADGRNAIFCMTTNLGAKQALGFLDRRQDYQAQLQAAIDEHFTPEFLNRVDRVVYFNPLDQDMLIQIFDKLFARVAARFRAQGIEVEVEEAFKHHLCREYTDQTRGARPLERAIEDEIVAPLTDKLLAGEIGPGMKVLVGEKAGLEVSEAPPAVKPKRSPEPPPVAGGGEDRDQQTAQNQARFDQAAQGIIARLRDQGIEVEIAPDAREFLCDPFWTGTTLEQALAGLVEQPVSKKLAAGDFQPGDRVRVSRYADHLEFQKVAEGEE